jgi:DnaD/phage-associated family protein
VVGLSEKTEVKIENNSILSNGYGLIPRTLMRDKTISIGAKGLYAYLASFAGTKFKCYPTRETILDDLNISRNTFDKYNKELKDYGYIKIERNRSNNGTLTNNIYHLIMDKRVVDNSKPRLKNCAMDSQPETKNCAMDETVGNADTYPETKNCAMDTIIEIPTNQSMAQNLKEPWPKICATNSNSININKPYMYIGEEENKTVDKSISEFKRLYEQNIAPIYPATRDWILETSNEIDLPLFKRAIEICVEKEATQLAYLKGVLRKWSVRDINTYEQLQAYEAEHRKQKEAKTKKTNNVKEQSYKSKKTKFHNFEETFTQYSEAELDEIIRKSQREKFK